MSNLHSFYSVKRECAVGSRIVFTTLASPEGKIVMLTMKGKSHGLPSIAGGGLPCGISIPRRDAANMLRAARRKA